MSQVIRAGGGLRPRGFSGKSSHRPAATADDGQATSTNRVVDVYVPVAASLVESVASRPVIAFSRGFAPGRPAPRVADTAPSVVSQPVAAPAVAVVLKPPRNPWRGDPDRPVLLTEKYRPTASADIFGNRKSVEALRHWIAQRKGSKATGKTVEVVAVLTGPPGVGKTTTATVLLKEAGYNVFELNASDGRTRDVLYNHVKESVTRKALPGKKPVAVILDELDGAVAHTGEDGDANSGIAGVLKFVAECEQGTWSVAHPVICICNDTSSKLMRSLLNKALHVRFFPPWDSVMKQVLDRLVQREQTRLSPQQQQHLVEAARGDIRRLYQLYQMYAACGKRGNVDDFVEMSAGDEFDDTFAAARKLIYQPVMSVDMACKLVYGDQAIMALMVQHNFATLAARAPAVAAADSEYHSTLEDLATLYHDVSLVDTMDSQRYINATADKLSLPDTSGLLAMTVRVNGKTFRSVNCGKPLLEFTTFFAHQSQFKSNKSQRSHDAARLGVNLLELDLALRIDTSGNSTRDSAKRQKTGGSGCVSLHELENVGSE